jgi:hypothetical protein
MVIHDEKQTVKVTTNRAGHQCWFTIPKGFWKYFSKTGYYELTVDDNGKFIYTPTNKPDKMQRRPVCELPVFEDDNTK